MKEVVIHFSRKELRPILESMLEEPTMKTCFILNRF